MMRWALAAAAFAFAGPALAQDDVRFCPQRPSLGASGCTTKPGQVQVEWSAFDWQRDDSADGREDRFVAADTIVRIGIARTTEVQIGWTAVGRVRTRDALTGAIDAVRGVGDVQIGLRQNLSHPDGKGLSIGVQPFVTLPVGRTPIGDGDWGAGVVLPVSYDIGGGFNLNVTTEADAAVDQDGHGRHLAYSGILGLGYDLSDKVTLTGELMAERDDDPMRHATHTVAAASLAYQPTKRFQIDALAVVGLNRDTPDLRLVTGGAILF
ncbi:transporter [Sphingomonas sp. RS2018]